MPNPNHEEIVEGLVCEGWSRGKFPQALRDLFSEDCEYCAETLANGDIDLVPIKAPDAYRIDKENLLVQVAEVDCSQFLTEEKWAALVDLAWALDEDYYNLELVRIDQFGQRLIFPCLVVGARVLCPSTSKGAAVWRKAFSDVAA